LNYSAKSNGFSQGWLICNCIRAWHQFGTRSSEGVCGVPITSTRTGMASCGIFVLSQAEYLLDGCLKWLV
jgi:hypothetical protein